MAVARKTFAVLSAALVCAGVAAIPAQAQADGRISGTVWIDRNRDGRVDLLGEGPHYPAERPRAYIEISILSEETGQFRHAQTNRYGEFNFSGLPHGTFSVLAAQIGMRSLGPIVQTVELTADAPVAPPLLFPQLGNNISVNAVFDSDGDGILTGESEKLDHGFHVQGIDDTGRPVYSATAPLGPANVIEGLPAGVYTVYASPPPAGRKLTKPNARTNADPVDQDSDFTWSLFGPATLPHVFTGDDGEWSPGFGLAEGDGRTNPVLTNAASGWCLDQEHPTGTATKVIGSHHCNGGANQRWESTDGGADVVVLKNERTRHCADQEHPAGVATTVVGAHPCNGGANQRWRVVHDERVDEAATLVNVATGHCLDQEYPRGSATTKVGAYPCNGGANQKWLVRSPLESGRPGRSRRSWTAPARSTGEPGTRACFKGEVTGGVSVPECGEVSGRWVSDQANLQYRRPRGQRSGSGAGRPDRRAVGDAATSAARRC
ncbi:MULTISPECIES: RICIN domain-containing protein [Actinosynnema]|uniref:RICIN domain-containing protein n=1 Tax=Actinosynnema TaxID=40566 RepID=UPI0020A3E421|nr:RICIN domain-containing protein [Actinosynnema pretiosum]MCP2098219.1 Ricin-type beta-trefoil lectin domain-like [Actinosynnema pretiosum]